MRDSGVETGAAILKDLVLTEVVKNTRTRRPVGNRKEVFDAARQKPVQVIFTTHSHAGNG
jgi:hypothetical protein